MTWSELTPSKSEQGALGKIGLPEDRRAGQKHALQVKLVVKDLNSQQVGTFRRLFYLRVKEERSLPVR